MELRKIQVTGGSSFMVTLPKEWAESVGLRKNDTVGLAPQSDGSMLIVPGDVRRGASCSSVTITVDGDTDGDFLYRRLVGAYIAGHDSIVVECPGGIPSHLASVASAFTQTAIGFEIMEESDDLILIKDLMDPDEVRPIKSVERMKVLVKNMYNDVFDAAGTDGKGQQSLADRDREVDRLYWLVSRQVSLHLKDPSMSRRSGLTPSAVSRCAVVARSIERMGDHVVQLDSNLRAIVSSGDTGFIDRLLPLKSELMDLLRGSVRAWVVSDMGAADRSIVTGRELVRRFDGLLSGGLHGGLHAGLAVGNLRRIAEYSVDICEVAINSAMD